MAASSLAVCCLSQPCSVLLRPAPSHSAHRAPFSASCAKQAARLHAAGGRAERRRHRPVAAAAGGGDSSQLAEIAALDQLIDALLAAKDPQQLAETVGQNIMSFDTQFWLRLAARRDAASSDEVRSQLSSLARHVQSLVEGMVQQTQKAMDTSSELLQRVVTAGADPGTGEWSLPLAPERLAAMRKVLADNRDRLDEALLSTCYAWIRKADADKLEGMVSLLQKVLQLYASLQLSSQPAAADAGGQGGASDELLSVLLGEDERVWDALLRTWAGDGSISELALMEALQRRMEGVVLGLASGSYAQRVQAEYLKEVEARARAVFAELAKAR